MKKFNPEKEINNYSSSNLSRDSKVSNAFIPLLVLGCSCLAMIGITFSYKIVESDVKKYNVDIEIFNGEESSFHTEAVEGEFSARIVGKGVFVSMDCSQGSMNYDSFTESITNPSLNSDVKCDLFFGNPDSKYLTIDNLNPVNDNFGTSYYFKADAKDNYIKVNNMMFRILRINGDGTLRLVLNDNSLSTTFGKNNIYENSNLKAYLNNWFKQHFAGKKYVVLGDFDYDNYSEVESESLISLEGYHEAYVGTVSVREADLVLKDTKSNYLGNIVLLNGNGVNNVFSILNGKIVNSKVDANLSVKPVINIKYDVLDGIGTANDPYVLKED